MGNLFKYFILAFLLCTFPSTDSFASSEDGDSRPKLKRPNRKTVKTKANKRKTKKIKTADSSKDEDPPQGSVGASASNNATQTSCESQIKKAKKVKPDAEGSAGASSNDDTTKHNSTKKVKSNNSIRLSKEIAESKVRSNPTGSNKKKKPPTMVSKIGKNVFINHLWPMLGWADKLSLSYVNKAYRMFCEELSQEKLKDRVGGLPKGMSWVALEGHLYYMDTFSHVLPEHLSKENIEELEDLSNFYLIRKEFSMEWLIFLQINNEWSHRIENKPNKNRQLYQEDRKKHALDGSQPFALHHEFVQTLKIKDDSLNENTRKALKSLCTKEDKREAYSSKKIAHLLIELYKLFPTLQIVSKELDNLINPHIFRNTFEIIWLHEEKPLAANCNLAFLQQKTILTMSAEVIRVNGRFFAKLGIERAVSYYDMVIYKHVSVPVEALIESAYLLLKHQDYQKAVDILALIYDNYPKHYPKLSKGLWAKFQELKKSQRKRKRDQHNMIEALISLFKEKNFKEAAQMCEKVIKGNPDHIDAWRIRCGYAFHMAKNYIKAVEYYEQATVENLDLSNELLKYYPSSLNNVGQEEKARIQSAVILKREADLLMKQAFKKNNYQKAAKKLEEAIITHPNPPTEWYADCGDALFSNADFKAAGTQYKLAIEKHPNPPAKWYKRYGDCLSKNRQHEMAAKNYKIAIETNPDAPDNWKERYWNSLYWAGYYLEAAEEYEKAIRSHRYSPPKSWYQKYAECLLKLGETQKAATQYRIVIDRNPKSASANWHAKYGELLLKLNNDIDAADQFRLAIGKNRDLKAQYLQTYLNSLLRVKMPYERLNDHSMFLISLSEYEAAAELYRMAPVICSDAPKNWRKVYINALFKSSHFQEAADQIRVFISEDETLKGQYLKTYLGSIRKARRQSRLGRFSYQWLEVNSTFLISLQEYEEAAKLYKIKVGKLKKQIESCSRRRNSEYGRYMTYIQNLKTYLDLVKKTSRSVPFKWLKTQGNLMISHHKYEAAAEIYRMAPKVCSDGPENWRKEYENWRKEYIDKLFKLRWFQEVAHQIRVIINEDKNLKEQYLKTYLESLNNISGTVPYEWLNVHGMFLISLQEYEKAAEIYRMAPKICSDRPENWREAYLDSLYNSGNDQVAANEYRKAIEQEPNPLAIWHAKYGELLQKLGRYAEAADQLKLAIGKNRDLKAQYLNPYLESLINFSGNVQYEWLNGHGMFLISLQESEKAAIVYRMAPKVCSYGPENWYERYLNVLSYTFCNDLVAIANQFKMIIEQEPNPTAIAHVKYGELLKKLGRYAEAADQLKLAIGKNRDLKAQYLNPYLESLHNISGNVQYEWLNGHGMFLISLQEYEKAADVYRMAPKISPDGPKHWLLEGFISSLNASGHKQEAANQYKKFIEQESNPPAIAHAEYGELLKELGRYTQAAKQIKVAIDKDEKLKARYDTNFLSEMPKGMITICPESLPLNSTPADVNIPPPLNNNLTPSVELDNSVQEDDWLWESISKKFLFSPEKTA